MLVRAVETAHSECIRLSTRGLIVTLLTNRVYMCDVIYEISFP